MSKSRLGMIKDSLVKYGVSSRTLLVPWGNPLPNVVWYLLQVSRESLEWANLRGILGRSGGHVG